MEELQPTVIVGSVTCNEADTKNTKCDVTIQQKQQQHHDGLFGSRLGKYVGESGGNEQKQETKGESVIVTHLSDRKYEVQRTSSEAEARCVVGDEASKVGAMFDSVRVSLTDSTKVEIPCPVMKKDPKQCSTESTVHDDKLPCGGNESSVESNNQEGSNNINSGDLRVEPMEAEPSNKITNQDDPICNGIVEDAISPAPAAGVENQNDSNLEPTLTEDTATGNGTSSYVVSSEDAIDENITCNGVSDNNIGPDKSTLEPSVEPCNGVSNEPVFNGDVGGGRTIVNGVPAIVPNCNGISSKETIVRDILSGKPIVNGILSAEPMCNGITSNAPHINGNLSGQEPVVNGVHSNEPICNGISKAESRDIIPTSEPVAICNGGTKDHLKKLSDGKPATPKNKCYYAVWFPPSPTKLTTLKPILCDSQKDALMKMKGHKVLMIIFFVVHLIMLRSFFLIAWR